jgi:hypothetical protein
VTLPDPIDQKHDQSKRGDDAFARKNLRLRVTSAVVVHGHIATAIRDLGRSGMVRPGGHQVS